MALELISTNPANNKIIGRYKMYSDAQLNTFVDSADKTFYKWKKTTLNERSRLLFKLAEVLENHTEDAKLITEEMGKPIESAKAEILKCASLCRFYASNLEEYLREDKILEGDKNSSIVYCPLGALLGIMPWNFPYWQVIRFAVPAIAAGNTILLKHASNVSASALQLEKYFKLAGFPDHVSLGSV